jgi:hypothetical protein
MKTPIVLIIYHRPKLTAKVINSLREVKPSKIFVVADGPKNRFDEKLCQETRALIKLINWKCKIYKNYAHRNLGVRKRVVSGLDWVFSKVSRAIIIEDDLEIDKSFYKFCSEMLEKYKDEEKIISIAGNNFLFGKYNLTKSYLFSRYVYSTGWATWKRAWKLYDNTMTKWPSLRETSWLHDILGNRVMELYWKKIFDMTYAEKVDSWAYRWTYSSFLCNGLTITPKLDLVAHIGYGEQATHTKRRDRIAGMKTAKMNFPLIHPKKIIRNARADTIVERNIYLNNIIIISLFIRSFLE